MSIQIKYTEFFTLSLEQLFYTNKTVKDTRIDPELDFEFIVLPESLHLLKRMNLLIRKTYGKPGIVVLAPVKEKNTAGDSLLRYPTKEVDKIGFGIVLKNSDVLNQNDLPLGSYSNKVFYFNNNINDTVAIRSSLHLSRESDGVKSEDLLKTSGQNYKFHEPAIINSDGVELKHLASGKTFAAQSLVVTEGETDLFFSLTSLPTGKCELRVGGILKDAFYYVGKGLAKPTFAIVEFLLSPVLESNYRIVEPDGSITQQRPRFVITFNNRKTIWRYTFQLHEGSPLFQELAALSDVDKTFFLAHLNIVSNDSGVTFKLKNTSERRLVFESENNLFLKEKYVSSSGALKLTLEKNLGLPNQATVKNNLQFPLTKLVDTSIPSFVFSDIFLTI